jgi:transglutaminase-like putative cysteine protease
VIEAFTARRGVCQDFAHIMLACLRSLGLSARYVSGYLRTTASGSEPASLGTDASHAWVSVFCPPFGWIDLDPTNDVRVSTGHIVIAWGRDFGDVSPLRGVIVGGGRHRLSVRVSVQAE